MAVRADGGAHIAPRDRFRVHAFAISKQRPIADAASLHHRLVAMTTAASLSDIRAIDRRLRITRRKHRRHVAVFRVTVETCCRFDAVTNRLCVKAVIVSRMWHGVKKRAR